MTTAGALAKWISWPAGANMDYSSWASHEATSTCVDLQILFGMVYLTGRTPESCACEALYSSHGAVSCYVWYPHRTCSFAQRGW